jgi:hypothetical protein
MGLPYARVRDLMPNEHGHPTPLAIMEQVLEDGG